MADYTAPSPQEIKAHSPTWATRRLPLPPPTPRSYTDSENWRTRKYRETMEESMRKKLTASEFCVEKNPFNRLPKELIVTIFDKISDAKCLCICSLVSKNFASLVLQTHVVFVEMPGVFKACTCHRDPAAVRPSRLVLSLLRNIPYFLFKPLIALWTLLKYRFRRGGETALSNPGIMNFLMKFSCADSIIINFSLGSVYQLRFEPLLRWKYGSSGFIFISAKNRVASTDENIGDSSVQTANDLAMEEIILSLLLVGQHILDSILRVTLIRKIIAGLQNIKNVVAVDYMKQGRVVLDEEGIAGLKEKNPLDDRFCLKLWKAPVVKLPLSGCIMKEVSLILFRQIECCDTLVAENSFEEEEYHELAMILVKKEASFEKIVSLSDTSSN
ncbi:F-box protein At4g18380-like [Primulina huaijiensis]|uniref:F-box protein At4g18380-like n=1 Tax=Primulina huaijiensis TaxID=1492673 RepID=UPI003CC6E292